MKSACLARERRIITVLAVDIVGSTRHIAQSDPEDAQAFFDRCFDHVGEIVRQSGGKLISFEGDGGIATFGWPQAREDHADSACAAAWKIQHDGDVGCGPDGRPVRFRVGVHSGLVAVRELRGGGRSRFNAVGAAVHVAAKLQQRAEPGDILVSDETARLCRAALDLSRFDLPPSLAEATAGAFTLGKPPEARAHRDIALRYKTAMIGRQAELARLLGLLRRRDEAGSAVAVIGEPGIGKSRLAAAAVVEAEAIGARTLVFFGDAQHRATPFNAARSLIRDVSGSDDPGAAVARVLTQSGLDLGELPALELLVGASTAKFPRRRIGLTDTQLARLLAKAFSALALDQPTLLLVEDLHLVDDESRRFLQLLAQAEAAQPLCLVITARPEALQASREIAAQIITLRPLPRNAMKAVGRLLWPDGRDPGPTLDRLVDRADGVPFVLEELIHSHELRHAAGSSAVPQGVESLIHARLQRLSPGARSLAQALSLLGDNVDLDFASVVMGVEPAILDRELAELERFAFVHRPWGRFAQMRHQIIADACVDTIANERRRGIHRAAVAALRSRHRDLRGHYSRLAFHAEGAGDAAAAVDYLWEGALEARRSSATASLALIFDRAMKLIESIGEEADAKYVDFVLMAFASMVQLGEFDKMNRHLARVMELARAAGKPALTCATLSQLAMIRWFEGRYEEGLRASEEGLAIARELKSPALTYSNQFMLANNLHCTGQVTRAIEVGHDLCAMLTGDLETARLGAAGIPRATALSFMSWFMMDVGRYEEGLYYAQAGLDLALREREPYSEVLARHGLAHNLLMLDRNREALDCLQIAREISEHNGYDAIKTNLAGRMAIALSRTGRAAEAIAVVEDCLRKQLHLRTGQLELYYLHAGYAEALVGIGETDRGLGVLSDALAIARQIRNPCLIANALGLRARLLAKLRPDDPQIDLDLAERNAVCAEHGLVAWAPARPRASRSGRCRSEHSTRS